MSSHRFEYSVVAQCRPEHAWKVFSDVERWPQWNTAISAAKWSDGGAWSQGSTLKLDFKNPPMHLKLAVVEISAPNKLVLRGEVMGVTAVNQFHFTGTPDGQTKLEQSQELAGMALSFMPDSMKGQTDKNLQTGLDALKVQAEELAKDDTVY